MTTPTSNLPPTLPPIRSLDIDITFPTNQHLTWESPAPVQMNSSNMSNDIAAGVLDNQVESQPVQDDEIVQDGEHSFSDDDHDSEDDDDSIDEDGQEEDDDDENDERDDREIDLYPWQPLKEDTSTPCEDEMTFIQGKEEHSAIDHIQWEKQTFYDVQDPQMQSEAQGRISWTVTAFNGTKTEPNRQLVMRSKVVRIGGYDWQIKFYPKGNGTEFLSVYLECTTMSKNDFVAEADFNKMPLPVLADVNIPKQRVSVAAQLSVIMYNPAEPRVYEFKSDAHQFNKDSKDFGWKYFSREPQHNFHTRKHGQRQAILRNDQLAFTAYIRIINDPTGCLWRGVMPHISEDAACISSTGLRPFDGTSARLATYTMLYHLSPFRAWLESLSTTSIALTTLQVNLGKFLMRTLKRKHFKRYGIPDGCDVVAVLHGLRALVVKDAPEALATFDSILGGLDARDTLICHNRMKTKNVKSMADVLSKKLVNKHTPTILIIELDRHNFNKSERKWKKTTDRVPLENQICHNGTFYALYAFITHTGALGSGTYIPHVRPNGPDTLWYAYEPDKIKCLTQEAAEARFIGVDAATGKAPVPTTEKTSKLKPADLGIAYLTVYVQLDRKYWPFEAPIVEKWQLSENLRRKIHGIVERAPTATDAARPAILPAKPAPSIAVADRATQRQERQIQYRVHTPNLLVHDLMDGDDVIMSDVEDSVPSQAYINSTMQSSEPTVEPEGEVELISVCINYFSGEYYDGYTTSDGIYHGRGHLIATNGDEYDGEFKHGKPEGQGTMVYSNTGNKYVGDWLGGLHHGHGKLVEKDSGNVYDGGFKEGRRHGAFVLRGNITDDDKQFCQICYENEMTTAFYDCGHVLACRACASQIQTCPVCRKQVIARLELFGVKISME